MVYNNSIILDGHVYPAGTDVPDMGSVKCIKADGNRRDYVFLSADSDKLPTYDDFMSGSSALAVDASAVYVYEQTTKKWYQQGD